MDIKAAMQTRAHYREIAPEFHTNHFVADENGRFILVNGHMVREATEVDEEESCDSE